MIEKEKLEQKRKEITKMRLQSERKLDNYGPPVHLNEVRTLGVIHISNKPKPPPKVPEIKEEPKIEHMPLPKLEEKPQEEVDNRKPILKDNEIPMSYREEPINKPPTLDNHARSEGDNGQQDIRKSVLPSDLKKQNDSAILVPPKEFRKEGAINLSEEQKEMYEGA